MTPRILVISSFADTITYVNNRIKELIFSSLPEGIFDLREAFSRHGRDIRVVGGAVRDAMCGVPPRDVDLSTDATPEEQAEIYKDAGVSMYPTGLAHGTWTVFLREGGEPIEITSLRLDINTDGRHADVAWTNDWELDLYRRDLTINAMAMDLDGNFHDPHGGAEDLFQGRVRFVGRAEDRIQEDYLRILRWLRFEARFGLPLSEGSPDREAMNAIRKHGYGLEKISKERIWSEMSRIVSGKRRADEAMVLFSALGLSTPSGIPQFNLSDFLRHRKNTADAAVLFGLSCPAVDALAATWKWSQADRERAVYVKNNLGKILDLTHAKVEMAKNGARREHVAAVLGVQGMDVEAQSILKWEIPSFPAVGNLLKARGMAPGPEMGEVINTLRQRWSDEGFTATAEELVNSLETFPTLR